MSKYVTDILTQETLQHFTSQLWSQSLSGYLTSHSDMFYYHIQANYKDLLCSQYISEAPSWVGAYLFARLSNEFERIYVALTYQYIPYYNYYRKISEKNSGSDSNVYSGTDSNRKTGTDSVHHSGTDSIHTEGNNDTHEYTEANKPITANEYSSTYDDTNKATMKPTVSSETIYDTHSDTEYSNDDRITHGEIIETTYGTQQTETYGKNLTMNFGRNVDTIIEGINGLFSPQDLIRKEVVLRLEYNLFETFVRMIIECVSSGVWDTE